MPSLQFQPGRQWLSKLERQFLLRPSIFGHQHNLRYHCGVTIVFVSWIFLIFRYFLGAVSPDLALSLGNGLNVLGRAGQIVNIAVGTSVVLILYFRIRFLRLKDAPFFDDIAAYDDPRRRTVLDSEFRGRMMKFLNTAVTILNVVSKMTVINMMVCITIISLVVPLMVLGVSTWNVFFWSANTVFFLVAAYFFAVDWVYIFGSWFLCKSHLDYQAENIIEVADKLLNGGTQVRGSDVACFDIRYKQLVKRTKIFDYLSQDLITPYRLVLSYVCGVIIFGAHQQDNFILKIGLDSVSILYYIVSFAFLFTACSLTTRRRLLYVLTNELFLKTSQQKTTSLRQLITLRRIIKSLGALRRPLLSLTDKSGEEFDPMETVKFLLQTFANFALAATIYHDFVK